MLCALNCSSSSRVHGEYRFGVFLLSILLNSCYIFLSSVYCLRPYHPIAPPFDSNSSSYHFCYSFTLHTHTHTLTRSHKETLRDVSSSRSKRFSFCVSFGIQSNTRTHSNLSHLQYECIPLSRQIKRQCSRFFFYHAKFVLLTIKL